MIRTSKGRFEEVASASTSRPKHESPQAKEREPLLPDSMKSPLILLWVAVLPQLVLVLINLRAFWLVSGELASWQKTISLRIFACEIFLLLAVAVVAVTLRLRAKLISGPLNWPLLFAPILYLWLITYQIGNGLIPLSVSAWILPPDQLLYYQFALIMPLIFYAGVRLACIDFKLSLVREVVSLGAIIVGLPLGWYFLFQTDRFFHVLRVCPAVVLVVAAVISTVLVLAAAARSCVGCYVGMRRKGPLALGILSFVVVIVAPIGGLWLNAHIPFPSDFQGWSVYAMAVANGCVLLLPNFRHLLLHRLVWLAQCAFFPFTFYFFLVFLPFLPLSIPAMLLAGAGFLILTPTALFLIHGQRILDGYRDEIRGGRRLKPALLGALALAILPGIFVGQAAVDRVVLRGAIDYVYSPDFRRADRFSGSPEAVRRSLERLRDFKAGLQLPFLSDFYNWAVFDNLALPDEKMTAIHRAFFGHDLAPVKQDRISFFGGRPARGRTLREVRPAPAPPNNVSLVDLTATTLPEGACARTTLVLDLQNSSAVQSEFVTQIKIPEGVLVSGFWLKIGEERVPGKLYEKKSALWVYQMIRDRSQRDPGILVYSDPHSIELRVFPFAAGEQRRAEIQFLYPAMLHPAINIGDREWRANGDAAAVCLALTDEGTSSVSLTPRALMQLPRAERAPYLHFIVERSAGAQLRDEDIVRAIHRAAAEFGNVRECSITVANYECKDVTNGLVPIDSINAATLGNSTAFPHRGGFLAERAIKRALLAYHDQLSRAVPPSPWLGRFPLIVVISDPRTELSFSHDLVHFAKLAPDADKFYIVGLNQALRAYNFNRKPAEAAAKTVQPVALLKVGDSVSACRLDGSESQMMQFEASKASPSLSVFDHGAFNPLEPASTISSDSAYSRGLRAWQHYLALIYDPSLGNSGLAAVVDLSRESGVLVAGTSYIVVENSAQWKTLDLKQRQKLRNQNALEFEQIPEPETWFLVLIGGGILLYARVRRRSSDVHELSGV